MVSNGTQIGHFYNCLVAWLVNANEAGGDLALIKTFLLFTRLMRTRRPLADKRF